MDQTEPGEVLSGWRGAVSTGTNTELRTKKQALSKKIPGFGRKKGKRRERSEIVSGEKSPVSSEGNGIGNT